MLNCCCLPHQPQNNNNICLTTVMNLYRIFQTIILWGNLKTSKARPSSIFSFLAGCLFGNLSDFCLSEMRNHTNSSQDGCLDETWVLPNSQPNKIMYDTLGYLLSLLNMISRLLVIESFPLKESYPLIYIYS